MSEFERIKTIVDTLEPIYSAVWVVLRQPETIVSLRDAGYTVTLTPCNLDGFKPHDRWSVSK